MAGAQQSATLRPIPAEGHQNRLGAFVVHLRSAVEVVGVDRQHHHGPKSQGSPVYLVLDTATVCLPRASSVLVRTGLGVVVALITFVPQP
jgi:hypothetical protein